MYYVLFSRTTIGPQLRGAAYISLDFSCGGLHRTQLKSYLSLVAWIWALKLEDGQYRVHT